MWRWLVAWQARMSSAVLGRREDEARRQHAELHFIRQEMDAHPWERREPWPGMEEGHLDCGTPLRPFELTKRPIFRPDPKRKKS